MKICMMFACIEPPWNGNRPFGKKYFKMLRMCIKTLIRTGFSADNILCIMANPDQAAELKNKYGVRAINGPTSMPPEFYKLISKNRDAYYFYKPVAFYHAVPEPITEDTVMCWCDVDALFKKNPESLLLGQSVDVWTSRGAVLPNTRRKSPPKRYHNPRLNYKDLKEYYYKNGGGAIANLHLTYGFPSLPKNTIYTAWVAVKPHVYTKLIKLWYEMCLISVQRDDLERGDQEIFSAAVWHLGLSNERARKVIKGWCTQYGGDGKKSEMKGDFQKFCRMIDRRNARK